MWLGLVMGSDPRVGFTISSRKWSGFFQHGWSTQLNSAPVAPEGRYILENGLFRDAGRHSPALGNLAFSAPTSTTSVSTSLGLLCLLKLE